MVDGRTRGVSNPRVVDVSHQDADEQHEGHAQGDASKLDFAQLHTQADDQGVDYHQMGNRSRVVDDFD